MKALPPRGYYVEAPVTPTWATGDSDTFAAIVWWTGDRCGSYWWRTDHKHWHKSRTPKWTTLSWPCAIESINTSETRGPFTFEELTKLVSDPAYGDNDRCLAVIGRAPGDDEKTV